MPEQRRYHVWFKSKAGDQRVTVLARDRDEAVLIAGAHQDRRARRYQVTMNRLEAGEGAFAEMSKEQRKAELDRRKRDFSRYDVLTVNDRGDEVKNSADAPMKVGKVEAV